MVGLADAAGDGVHLADHGVIDVRNCINSLVQMPWPSSVADVRIGLLSSLPYADVTTGSVSEADVGDAEIYAAAKTAAMALFIARDTTTSHQIPVPMPSSRPR